MKSSKELCEEYGLTIYESEAPDRLAIDFSIDDGDDNIAWAWGDGEIVVVDNQEYTPDYEVECDHAIVEYGDDDERGECIVCGATCDWHYEKEVVNEGHDEDGNYYCQTGEERVPHEWHRGDGGIIRKYINEQLERRNNVRK